MAAEQEFDDLLRKKLGGVKPPAPPAMDWSMMARTAKTGTPFVAHTGGSLPMWKIMIGAAAVSGMLWYGYTVRSASAETAERTIAVADDAHTTGQPANTIVAQPTEAGTSAELSPDATPISEFPVGSDARPRHSAEIPAGRPNIQAIARVSPTVDPGGPLRTNESAPKEASTIAMAMLEIAGPTILVQADQGTYFDQEDIIGQRTDDAANVVAVSADAPMRMDGLLPTAAPLNLIPNDPPLDPPGNAPFPRFALSPWLSVARSIHSPAPTLVADQVESLGGLNEWLGTAGVRVEYAITPRVALISGLQYANKGRLQGTISTSPDITTDYAVSGAYLEVPLSVKYEFPQAGKTFYARSGVLMQFNARAGSDKVVMHDQGLKEMSTLALSSSSMGVALDLAAGIRFRLGRGIGLFIEPSYQYALSPVVKNSVFDRLPYNPRIHSFGLGTGLTFQLGSR